MTEDWKYYFKKSTYKVCPSFEAEVCDLLHAQVSCLHDLKHFKTEDFDIAIIGVADGRCSVNKGVADFPDAVRPFLYGLRSLTKPVKIIDFGNVLGRTVDDRYRVIEDLVNHLVSCNVLPLVLGGSQDYTIPMAGAIKQVNNAFRLSVVDAKIDWVTPEKDFSSNGFLGLLCSAKERCPYDLSIVGVQKYLYSHYQEEQMKKASFDLLRLGEIRQKGLKHAEPWLRDADLVSFDLNCVKQADQPACNLPRPNGFTGEEFCQLSWYAGMSDKLKALGFFELDAGCDLKSQGVALAAQAIWHVMEGYCLRYNDFPVKALDDYVQHIVHLDEYELNIRFYHNPENDRWWVEIPGCDHNDIVACSRGDFEDASKKDIPERWFRFVRKKVL